MTAVHPVQILMDEHQTILRVLDAIEARVNRLGQEPFPAGFFTEALDFCRNFADGCHHFKEEDTLFPAMIEKGFSRESGPIAVMLADHDFGRACLKAVRENLEPPNMDIIRQNALAYVQMLRQHIYKEDNILFRMAVNVLDEQDVARLDAIFADESNPKINAAVREKYAAVAARLTA
jgi:hemerythrin-like domain-containing protein